MPRARLAHQGYRVRSIAFGAAALLLSLGVVDALAASSTDARGQKAVDLRAFLTGLACTESGGRFDALNEKSGSYGKYQIMPRNWPAWAARYMHNRWAKPTPQNQEFVVRERVLDIYEKRGSWRMVALWWLTGDNETNEMLWTNKAAGYVNHVMGIAQLAADPRTAGQVKARCFPADVGDPDIRSEPYPRSLITGGRVNVRASAGAENRVIDTVRRGTVVAILGRRDDPRGKPWRKIGLLDGRSGWVAHYFVDSMETARR
jgi:Bacterial SH3 domain